jgi:glucose/arabinose dehydrogenase
LSRRPSLRAGALAACVAAAAGALALGAPAQGASFRLAPVVGGLDGALYVTAAPGDARRLYVVLQGGQVRVVRDGRVRAEPFLDVSDRITSGGERGLLGLAFHPGYAENGRFFVNFTDLAGNTRVVELHAEPRAARASVEGRRVLLRVAQPYPNHNGGHLVFGPDGFLYVGLGDGGSGGDPQGNGQRLDTLLGKILRIDVDRRTRGRQYAIPRDNPLAGRRGARPEIFAYGLRNPWRFSFDRETGDLWIGDVGQSAREEIDFRPAGSAGAANFGWNAFEGSLRYPGGRRPRGRPIPPVAEYPHSAGCSVSGGYVARGPRVPALRGRYLYADYCTGALFSMRAGPEPSRPRRERGFGAALNGVTSFGEDARGDLLAVAGGRLLRFVSPPRRRAADVLLDAVLALAGRVTGGRSAGS